MDNKYDWIELYRKIADKLLLYKKRRDELVEIIKETYAETGINMPMLETDNNLQDIDPFTFFGLFNKNSMKLSNRISILSTLSKKLEIDCPMPSSFNGIPVLNNQNATFYYFIGDENRAEDDLDCLWNLFEAALKFADSPTTENKVEVSEWFDNVINKKGNGNSKITMALYWIAPGVFLNLDSRNEWFIYKSGRIPTSIVDNVPRVETKISAKKYFSIIEVIYEYLRSDECELNDFMDLSYEAMKYSNEMKKGEKTKTKRDDKGSALADADVDTVHYWIYSPGDGAIKWDEFYENGIMAIGWGEIGDLSLFDSKDDMKQTMKKMIDPSRPYINAAHATWQFANEMKVGDVIFVKKGMHQLVGKGIVKSDYYFDDSAPDEYRNIRKVNWTDNGLWDHPGQAVMKTLTDITAYTEYVERLISIFETDAESDEVEEKKYPVYDKKQFLEEVYMDEENYDTLVGLLYNKKNVILQGTPGVGKTFAAKRLAYSMIGEKNQDRVQLVQFHQSYSYEDFIEGFRPAPNGGFEIKKGSFYKFCKKAEEDSDNDYYFIIDEINRGNLSKIFGELFMLIENDKRDNYLQLLYSDEKFCVPSNVYIIGMMNTADRSLAMLDYALRRRFGFYDMKPGFETDGFCKYRDSLNSPKFNRLLTQINGLNDEIKSDETLGEGFCIGHSYFCQMSQVTNQLLENIVRFEIIPLIKEYWFDDIQKIEVWSDNLWKAIR